MNTKKRPIRVLIVDDMPQVRQDLRLILPLAGDEDGRTIQVVGEARDGQEAVQLVGEIQPDAVLMDLAMPVMDGYAATRAIKAANSNIRVIALSVHCDEASRLRAQHSGADGFVEKGAALGEIIQAIVS
jgi:DNA-binding NarL/FixJ family response regulator